MTMLRTAAITCFYRPVTVAAIGLLAASTFAAAQSPVSNCSPAAQLKARAATLSSLGDSDGAWVHNLMFPVEWLPQGLTSDPMLVLRTEPGWTISARPPAWAYGFRLSEALRKRESTASILPPSGVVITVTPSRIDAPNFIKLVLERNGTSVPPLESSLSAQPMTTAMNVTVSKSSGSVVFPCAAFDPDSSVLLLAIPESGDNVMRWMAKSELALLSGRYEQLAGALLDASMADVERRLGRPSKRDGSRWQYYEGALKLTFDKAGHLTDAAPSTFYIGAPKL